MAFAALIPAAQAGPQVALTTPLGQITVELHEDKPATVANFLAYINAGSYANSFAHRLALPEASGLPSRVLQGGGFTLQGNTIFSVPTFGMIDNEFSVGQIRSNVLGTLAMARQGGNPNSANSQWFFNLGNNAVLDGIDGGFTVFGDVIAGMDVLMLFDTTFPLVPSGIGGRGVYNAYAPDGVNGIRINSPAFAELPLLQGSLTSNNFIYTNWIVVPEPGISGLVISGAFVLLSARRRRPAVTESSLFR